MNILVMLQGSLATILQNWHLFIYLLIVQFAFAALTAWMMSDIRMDRESLSILAFQGGVLGLTLFSLSMVLLKIKPSPTLGIATVFFAILILFRLGRHLQGLSPAKIFLFFFFILLLRLIFIQDLLVPPYADSVTHLQIVQDFLQPNSPPQAFFRPSPDLERYYHFGFHSLAAWLSGVTTTPPEQTILILGQYFQALAILAIYPLARSLSEDSLSSWAMMIIAGLILNIPSYTSNWGKYPAISSLTGITFGISLFLIYARNRSILSNRFFWLIGVAILSAACLHSRSLLFLLMAGPAIFLSTKSNSFIGGLYFKDDKIENKTLVIMIWSILLHILTITLRFPSTPTLYFFEFLFWILTIVALFHDFGLVWTVTTFFLLIGLSTLLPIQTPLLPVRFAMIFDRQFLILLFYLPASLIIWKGLEGGFSPLFKNSLFAWRRWLFACLIAVGLINSIFFQNHRPSDCCVFMNDDDLFSFHWIEENIPQDAIIGIAATGKPGNLLPADGGAWLEQLTVMSTRKLEASMDFNFQTQKLCSDGITYFYVDSLENSFDEYSLKESGAIYQFGLGDVRLYHLECNHQK